MIKRNTRTFIVFKNLSNFMQSHSDLGNTNHWQTAFVGSLLMWTVPNFIGFAAKYWFLSKHGFTSVAGAASVDSLSVGQRLSFFRADLIFGFFLLPMCLALFRILLQGRWYWWFVATLAGFAVSFEVLAFAELAVLGNLAAGYGLLAEGLQWSMAHPKAALNYLMAYGFLGLFVVPMFIAATATVLIMWFWLTVKRHRPAMQKQIYFGVAVLWITSVPLTIMSWFPWMKPTGYHKAMLWLSVRPLFESESGEGQYANLPIETLRSIYEKAANVRSSRLPLYWGAATDYDVVLFVMETGPERLLSADVGFSNFPNLQRLSRNAFVGMQHYTTSPVSYNAVSSMLLSVYPPSHNRTFSEEPPRLPGLIRTLHAAGYQTGVYLPDVPGVYSRRENYFYGSMGPDQVSIPPRSYAPESIAGGWREAEYLDLASLRILEKDFRASTAAGRRFFGIYLPQLSHEPWVDITGGQEPNMSRRRYNLMKLEDGHLGELISTIQDSGRLNHTLIVVTCDHGLRSRASDPSFHEGQIDDLMFHVPFLLYAPGVVSEQINLPWPTSHIDIAPSILELLGISEGREFEVGTPIWNESATSRCIFFWGSGYFAADGYRCGSSFSMWNEMMNITYRSSVQHFTDSTAVLIDTATDKEIREKIQEMGALRNAWYNAAARCLASSRFSAAGRSSTTMSRKFP